jgi:hypothetical protein
MLINDYILVTLDRGISAGLIRLRFLLHKLTCAYDLPRFTSSIYAYQNSGCLYIYGSWVWPTLRDSPVSRMNFSDVYVRKFHPACPDNFIVFGTF